MLNHIVLMGRLTRDPELRRTGSGVAVASFTLAVDRDYAAQGAEKETDFVDIVAWRNTAEFVSKYFTKGRMAVVTGRLQIRNWQDKEGKKNTTLSPDLIELNFLTANGWVVADQQTTDERTVLYYTKAVKAGDTTPALSDTLRIDPKIATDVEKTVKDNTITYTYKYGDYTFHIDAEVDAVQTHNAKDAIKSAWGVDVDVDGNGNISLR